MNPIEHALIEGQKQILKQLDATHDALLEVLKQIKTINEEFGVEDDSPVDYPKPYYEMQDGKLVEIK